MPQTGPADENAPILDNEIFRKRTRPKVENTRL
jgi:hypothetical protein